MRRGTGLAPAILIAALVLTACGDPTVSGSGPVTSEDRDTARFSAVSITGAADLEFEQGTETSVTVWAEDDILPLITTEVRDDTAVVDSTDKYTSDEPVVVVVTAPEMRSAEVGGAGRRGAYPYGKNDCISDAVNA